MSDTHRYTHVPSLSLLFPHLDTIILSHRHLVHPTLTIICPPSPSPPLTLTVTSMHSQSLSFKPVTTPCLCSCAKQLRVSPIEINRITSIHYSYYEYPQSKFIHYSYCEYPQSTLLVLRVSNHLPPPFAWCGVRITVWWLDVNVSVC